MNEVKLTLSKEDFLDLLMVLDRLAQQDNATPHSFNRIAKHLTQQLRKNFLMGTTSKLMETTNKK